jgi:hypothetical protein
MNAMESRHGWQGPQGLALPGFCRIEAFVAVQWWHAADVATTTPALLAKN